MICGRRWRLYNRESKQCSIFSYSFTLANVASDGRWLLRALSGNGCVQIEIKKRGCMHPSGTRIRIGPGRLHLQTESLRYGRMKLCATREGARFVVSASVFWAFWIMARLSSKQPQSKKLCVVTRKFELPTSNRVLQRFDVQCSTLSPLKSGHPFTPSQNSPMDRPSSGQPIECSLRPSNSPGGRTRHRRGENHPGPAPCRLHADRRSECRNLRDRR